MNTKWFQRLIQVATISLTLAAVCQEMEKPKKERKWNGTIASFVPYDFRMPTGEKLRDVYWNPYESRIFGPEVFGVGWAINFYALLERLSLLRRAATEENFLMPGKHMKEVLKNPPVTE
ncbi:MAG TPA: hypothetical protein VMW00_05655 [Dehalococcoidales bacterium]|nr:hypothetical protein [Dehalococcoidales bacterium]